MCRVHELIMCRVDAVLNRTLVEVRNIKNQYVVGQPTFLTILLYFQQRNPCLFRFIAQECKYDAVFLLHRI